MRSVLIMLTLSVLLLPGAQHGFADLIDARHGLHGLHGHCHLIFVEAHAHEAHAHGAHEAHAHEAHAHEAHAHEAHAHEAHAHEAHAHEAGIASRRGTHSRLVLPRECSAPASGVPCPHSPLEGPGHHSHASPPMLCAPTPGTLSSWIAGRGLTFGARVPLLHARSPKRPLERPPRA